MEITGTVTAYFPPNNRGPALFKMSGGEAVKVWRDKHPEVFDTLEAAFRDSAAVSITASEVHRQYRGRPVTDTFGDAAHRIAGNGAGAAAPNGQRAGAFNGGDDPLAIRIRASWAITGAIALLEHEAGAVTIARVLEVARELLTALDTLISEESDYSEAER